MPTLPNNVRLCYSSFASISFQGVERTYVREISEGSKADKVLKENSIKEIIWQEPPFYWSTLFMTDLNVLNIVL